MNKTTPQLKLHRNSQKRYYIENAIYFITTNTYNGYPYFENDILCELFAHELNWCKQIQQFKTHGYKINPDHIHLLIQPIGKYNYSEIIRSLKTNFSRDANRIMGYNNSFKHLKARSRDLAFTDCEKLVRAYQNQFIKKCCFNHNIPQFKRQSSFHDHIIRNDFDYFQHLKYIQNQWIKHKLPINKWCWVLGENNKRRKNEHPQKRHFKKSYKQ